MMSIQPLRQNLTYTTMAMVCFEPSVKDNERFTKREACAHLGISHMMFDDLKLKGFLPEGQRIGKYLFFFGRDIKICHRLYFKQISYKS